MMKTKQASRWKHTAIAGAIAVALVGGQVLNLPDAAAIAKPAESVNNTWQTGGPNFANLVQEVKPAVVSIAITGKTDAMPHMQGQEFQMPEFPEGSPFNDFFKHFYEGRPGVQGGVPGGPRGDQHGSAQEFRAVGSGFIISADGYVVTNNHVIEHAEKIEVIMQDGTRHTAKVKGRDTKTDLALLKIKSKKPLHYVELGDSDKTRVGEWVVAVGNPFGLGGTVTAGIISARGRDIQSGPFDDFLQVDAPINKGNSGGPLFDSQGKVIGINTAIYSPSGGNVGIGFAIPSNMAKDIIAQLKSNGSVARGWLGVQIQPVSEEIAEGLGLKDKKGALVASVVPDSPAEKGGLKPGDVIISMDGETLDDFKDLSRLVAKAQRGDEVDFEIQRNGKSRELEIEIGKMPSDEVEVALANGDENDNQAKLGIYLAELSAEARQRYRIGKEIQGVLVTGVKRGSPAAKAGIRSGSVINMVGQDEVTSPDEVIEKVKHAAEKKHASVLLRIVDEGNARFVAVKFANV